MSRPRLPLRLEALEDRVLPSIGFTSFTDSASTSLAGHLNLSGKISDSNSPSSVSVTVNWGDGSSATTVAAKATATAGVYSFSTSHAYANPPSAGNPVFAVLATASDSTGAASTAVEAALVVDGLQGGQAITVAPGSTAQAQVTVGSFTGSFSVPVDHGSIVVFGGPSASAADSITVNEGRALSVAVYGRGKDALTVQDPIAANAIKVSGSSVTANGGTVAYHGLSSLLVSGTGGGDTVSITGIAAGVATTLDGVSGTASVAAKFGSAGFNGALTLNNFPKATFTDTGSFTGSLTVNGPGNLQQFQVKGTIKAGSSIALAGTLSSSTIGTNSGTISASAISAMSVTSNSGTISVAGQGTTSQVTIGTNTGTFTAVEGALSGSGVMTNTTIGTNSGTVAAGSISTMSITTNNGTVSSAGQGTTSNVTIGTNNGNFDAVPDSNPGSGVMSSTTIGTNNGTVSAGSISTMSVSTNIGTITASGTITSATIGTNSGSVSAASISTMSVTSNNGTVSVAGQGTTSNVSIGTNTGTFAAVEGATAGSGVMTSSTIGTNGGTVSAGSIATMSVTANNRTIMAAGQGTTSNVTIGTNNGTFEALPDSNPGSGVMSSTTIGTNSGTVSAGSISTMSVSTNIGTITASGTMSSTTVGTNGGAVSAASISSMSVTSNKGTIAAVENGSSGSGVMSGTTIGTNTGTVSAGSFIGMSMGTNSGTASAAGAGTTSDVTIDFNTSTGIFAAVADSNSGSGTMSDTTIGTNDGTISAATIDGMNVNTNNAVISADGEGDASDVTIGTLGASGTVSASGMLNNVDINIWNGVVSAGQIGTITGTNTPGEPQMCEVVEDGVTRTLLLSPVPGGSLPQSVNFIYDNTSGGNPQLTMAVNDGGNTDSYDVELLSSAAAAGAGFDLAALYAAPGSTAHIRNVLIEGNISPNAADAAQVGINSTVGGIQLPGVALAGVGVMGNAPAGSVTAASLEAVSFASITESGGTVAAAQATPADAAQLLAPGTAIVQVNDTVLAAAGQDASGQSVPVALFLATDTSGAFDPNSVLFGNQGSVIGATNPVIAQVTATIPTAGASSVIQSIDLTGDGGSIQTNQWIANAINSSGALGDLILQASQGITANITATSIFGNIAAPNGPISGTIQTTAGGIGQAFTSNGSVTGVTSITTPGILSGQIISAGDLVSEIDVGNSFTGVIAAGGSFGVMQQDAAGNLIRFGGLNVNSDYDGDMAILGNIFGDISVDGGLDGRIAAQGAEDDGLAAGRQGILGNILIKGGVGNSAAIVSGGEIGDTGSGTSADFTDLQVSGAVKGILAAVGQITYEISGTLKFASIFNDVGDPNSSQYDGGANQNAIDGIFAGLTIGDLTQILLNLGNLQVGADGNLTDA